MTDYAKITDLAAVTSVAAADLLEISQSQGGGAFLSKKVTVANSFGIYKLLAKRVTTAADATSITPNSDTADIVYQLNSQAVGTLTVNVDAGAPTNCQSLLFKIKSTNIQTFSWTGGAKGFLGGATALPTVTTGGGKIDYYSFIYDTVNSAWHFTGQAMGF